MGLRFSTDRLLKEFSTFGIGGPIAYFASVTTPDEMKEGIAFAKGQLLPFLIVGRGSNCLFPDVGFPGVVLLNKIDFCNWRGNTVEVGAGFSFSLLGIQSAKRGLTGLEFAAGIPASVGGAVFMNAGANGKETRDTLASVSYLHEDGSLQTYSAQDLVFSYRKSPFQDKKGAILSATFALQPLSDARQKQLEIIERRMATQPLKDKSAGCVFRNPHTGSAGALIDRAGLKGLRCGGAKVSDIHANFIVNEGHATAQDVLSLVHVVQEKVLEQTGIALEMEIKVIR